MPAPPQSLIILGGGLAGGLVALALSARRPEIKVTIVEAGEKLGGNHVWSFFESDIAVPERLLVEPLIVHRWSSYEVRFPEHRRHIIEAYRSITSNRFDEVLRGILPSASIVHGTVIEATPTSIALTDGRRLKADTVIDVRGGGDLSALQCGWQKFVGQSFHLAQPHGLDHPMVMDAMVDQADGYRFVYLLPFGPSEIFVEDTYYSDSPDLDVALISERIAEYVTAQGWHTATPDHCESGVLPVIMGGDFDRFWPAGDRVGRAGARAGLIQPLTSYSLPDAVRFAAWFAGQPVLADADTRGYARRHWRGGSFYRLLVRMLMRAADPSERYRVLQRFYRLPAPLIARFYAGQSTLGDRLRVLVGRPPVSIRRALGVLVETK